MARGFESKQVEDQKAEAERQRELRRAEPRAEPGVAARRRSLELARVDVRRKLAAASAPPLREMLTRALADLDAKLAALDD